MNGYRFVYQEGREAGASRDHLAILLGLRDGGRFLSAQLDSLARQTHRIWTLCVSDDGSTDEGPEIAARFARQTPGRVTICQGPQAGFSRNFLSLLARVPVGARYAAWCDQDDVWKPGKTARALRFLTSGGTTPMLYCGRTILTDATLTPIGLSPAFQRKPTFRNALVQSIAGGNTMVMNRAAIDLLTAAARYPGPVPSHDWWAYQIVTGAGGRVMFDQDPQVFYRQHPGNVVGGNSGPCARARRLVGLVRGTFRQATDQNLEALAFAADHFTAENRRVLRDFASLRRTPSTRSLASRGLYRQSRADTLALHTAALTGRL
jgi:hypothetical protein